MTRRRPRLVWVVAVLCFLMAIAQLVNHTLLLVGNFEMPDEFRAHIESWSTADWILPYLLSALLIAAASFLLALRSGAVLLFSTYLAVTILGAIWHAFTTNWFQVYGWFGVASALGGHAFFALLLWYSVRLRSRGVLA